MNKYNVIHIVEDASQSNFGVATSMFELIAQSKGFCNQQIVVAGNDNPLVNVQGVELHPSRIAWWGSAWRYASGFKKNLADVTKEDTLFHIHGIWMAPQLMAARFAVQHEIPFIITPHNMLGGWLWYRGKLRRLKKSLYWHHLVKPVFRQATAIHALTGDEAARLKEFFPDTPIVTIPNGIDLETANKWEVKTELPRKPYLLFLGRLHPAKGLELLFQALANIPKNRRIRLIVAGNTRSTDYERSLKELVNTLGIAAFVKFVGLVSGRKKWELLSSAWALCAPSYSEGMSMVVLEAMACSTPVITTHAAGFAELPEWGGILVHPVATELNSALMVVGGWSLKERITRGNMAFELISNKYSWDVVARRYDELYRNVLGWN